MVTAIVILLVIAILFGIGLAAKAAVFLLWIAAALFLLWIIGWFVGAAAAAGEGGRRWYYW
jgi:hypothetical protein